MSKNISLLGADYPAVPAVQLPQTGGGTATFYDINVIDNLNSTSSTDALSANQGRELNILKPNYYDLFCATANTYTYTFSKNTQFAIIADKINSPDVGYNGFYVGQAHNSGNVKAVLSSDGVTVSISGRTLTFVTSASNMSIKIIYFN